MIRLALAGATGRMGRCVLDVLPTDDRFALAAALVAPDDPRVGETLHVGATTVTLSDRLGGSCDVLLDFSVPAGTAAWLEVCRAQRIPMVIGATGHDAAQTERMRDAAAEIPIVLAANCSAGLNAVLALVTEAARLLGGAYDVEIIETHHRHKVDAPSGTALLLLDELLRARGGSREGRATFGRAGQTGPRPAGQIGVHAVRLGDLIGRHEIHFGANGETVTITHQVQSRESFALGALRAAAWVVKRPAGMYTMREVLGG